jgi:HEXXH motif-containing protein
MNPFEELTSCSSPHGHDSLDMVDFIVGEHARACTVEFLRRFRARLAPCSAGLVELLDQWVRSEISFDTAWDPSFALIRSSLSGSKVDPIRAASLLALRISAQGMGATWSVRLTEACCLYLDNIVLPASREIDVQSAKGELRLRLSSTGDERRTAFLVADADGWHSDCGIELPIGRMAEHQLRLAASEPLDDALRYFQSTSVSRNIAESDHTLCREAIRILHSHSPRYLNWVDKVIRELIVVKGAKGALYSASVDSLPATIAVSLPAAPMAIAESLVHEASHQYLHIVARMQDLSDQGDSRRYYSPVKGADRPIEMVLLAFHAFANVVIFYRECIATGYADKEYCQANIERHLPELEILCGHLRSPNSLTEIGTLIWKPLSERVFSSG